MTLLLRTVVVAILVVSTTSTPPPGYVKQPDNDKNPPSYRYKYEIEDGAGEGLQGKTEAREGELASGRYYVNSKRASTDVKYVADEWGYHPLVKYGSSDDHSSASASFAIGEQAVKNLQNENAAPSAPEFSRTEDRRKLLQIVQPYQLNAQQNTGENIIFRLSGNETAISNDSSASRPDSEISLQSESGSGSTNSLNVNYISHTPQQQIIEAVSPSSNNVFLAAGHQSSTIQQQSELVSSVDNDITSTVSEEDQLVVENAGSFGQRLHVQGDDNSAYFTATTTVSPIPTHPTISSSSSSSSSSPSTSSTRDGRYFKSRVRQKNGKVYLPDTIPGLGAYSSTPLPPLDNSVTANSIESESDGAQGHENNVESARFSAYATSGGSIDSGFSGATTPNPLLTNYASQGVISSLLKATQEKMDYGFAKPIVVPDVPKEKPFQYSTTFECEDDDVSSNTPNPLASIKDALGDTTSSHVLNPIQAGVALLNAGEAHLIGSGASLNETPPAPVNEEVEEGTQEEQAAVQQFNIIGPQGGNYVSVNPAFGGQQDSAQQQSQVDQLAAQLSNIIANSQGNNYVGINPAFGVQENTVQQQQQQQQIQQQSQGDQTVEIQKSIEIYHSSPAQEIHYSEQPAISRVAHTDQSQQTQSLTELQEQYFADLNSKQTAGGRTRGETLTNVYEITDNYPKDSAGDQPIYVVPPATYVVEDSSVLKNSLLQEKIQQYQVDVTGTDSTANTEGQQGETNVQNGSNQQYSSGTSYQSEIIHEQQQNIAPQTEGHSESYLEKSLHVSHAYPIEKVIEKKVPYPVEKIIEKKVPVPHPFPVPIPQPYPIHIEKVVERKVPVPVHIPIPHPYPVEKQIHIPVPIEKIVEKPVHIPITVEKIIEKKIPVPQPYPIEIEKVVERKIPYPVEVTKYIEKPLTVHAPYGVQYGVSYQQIMKPQNHGLYSHQLNNVAPSYALSVTTSNLYSGSKNVNDISTNNLNHSQTFQGYVYDKPAIPFVEGKENVEFSKKLGYNSYIPSNYPLSNALLHRRHATNLHRPPGKPDDYIGPVPPLHHVQQRQFGFQTKTFAAYPAIADRTSGSRKARTHEQPVRYQKGNFRQSKIEYGFKPPMVPSVQYDEETASKVES